MISVIISTYNHAKYINKCINAIFEQGKLITKIIIINDASTDNTVDILDEFKIKDSRIMVLNNIKNLGAIESYKLGIKYVESEFFALLSADDFLLPNWAECSISAFQLSKMASVCLSNTYIKDEETEIITSTNIPKELTNKFLLPHKFCNSVIKHGVWYSSNTALYRFSEYFEESLQGELGPLNDRIMISILGSKSGVVVSEKKLGCFYTRKKSMSGTVSKNNSSITLLNKMNNIVFRSNLFNKADKAFTKKVFTYTFYTFMNEHLSFILSEYINILNNTSCSSIQKNNIFKINFLLLIVKIIINIINKSFIQLLRVNMNSIYVKEAETKIINEYEIKINI